MTSKLVPANPSDVLVVRDLTPNVTTLSLPFLRGGVIEFGGRCTIARMSSGGVMVFSPTAHTPEAAAVVQRLGGEHGVKYLVAPDMEHHIFISEWAKEYPQARIIAPEGLAEKRKATKGKSPNVNVNDKFFYVCLDGKDPSAPVSVAPDFDADFALAYFDTHPNKELVLLYRPDAILIEADLLISLPCNEQYQRVDQATRVGGPNANLLNRLVMSVMNTQGDAIWPRRFMYYVFSRKNRPRFNKGIQLLNSWSFDTIIPCHGDVIEKNGKELFEKFFAWHLADEKKST